MGLILQPGTELWSFFHQSAAMNWNTPGITQLNVGRLF